MNQMILLILSLLSSTLALNNSTDSKPLETSTKCHNYSDCLNSGNISLFPNYIPILLTNNSENASIYSRDWNLIYGNSSTRMSSSEEDVKLINLTENQYTPDEMAVIMAFPMTYANVSLLESNESISSLSFDNSTDGNSSIDAFEVRNGLNFSGRILELLTLLSPLNLLNNKTPVLSTPYPTYAYTNPPPVHEDPYANVPLIYAEKSPNYESVPKEPAVKPNLEVSYN